MDFDVWLYGRMVAVLVDDGTGYLALRYVEAEHEGPRRRTVSLSLAGSASYSAQHGTMRWLRTVLPEGDVLDAVATHFRLDRDDVPGLLAQLGRDLVGAVRIVPSGSDSDHEDAGYEPATHDEIAAKIDQLPTAPLGVDRLKGHRMSLGGMQPKVVLSRQTEGGFAFPVNGAASTVIAKPEPEDYPGLVENEAALLRLADAAELPAARASIEMFADRRTLVVERFDRRHLADEVDRIHVEEGVAALGLQPGHKYQRGPSALGAGAGPRLRDLAGLLQMHAGSHARLALLDQTVFHVVTGNADAHMRNHSILLPPDGSVELAPLYDTVCTLAYENVDTDLSLRIGEAWDVTQVARADVLREADSWGLPPELARRRIDDVLERVRAALTKVDGPDRVMELIADRVSSLRP